MGAVEWVEYMVRGDELLAGDVYPDGRVVSILKIGPAYTGVIFTDKSSLICENTFQVTIRRMRLECASRYERGDVL